MTFWQGLVISLLTGNDNDDKEENSGQRIQNLLICLEMLGFSIAHYFVFPPMEWEEGYIRRRLELGFGDSIAFGESSKSANALGDSLVVLTMSRLLRARNQ